jgi:hypothetical protein
MFKTNVGIRTAAVLSCATLLLGCSAAPNDSRATRRAGAAGNCSVSDSQRRAMEDSANAFTSRATQLVLHPDSARWMAQWPTSGSVAFVNMGELTTSLQDQAALVGRNAHATPPSDLKIETTKVDVLAPDAVALTMSFTGTGTDPNTHQRSNLKGAYSAVLAVRDGKMRAIQQHQSFQPPQPE